jgi:hypothetical protein
VNLTERPHEDHPVSFGRGPAVVSQTSTVPPTMTVVIATRINFAATFDRESMKTPAPDNVLVASVAQFVLSGLPWSCTTPLVTAPFVTVVREAFVKP